MSILVKGMDIPKHCRNCKFSYFTHGISMKCLFISEACKIKGRLSDCPLVEIPTPHGRLIDADKAATSISMMNNHPCGNSIETVNDVVEWLRFADENGNNIAFPTIIEAEVSE